MTDKLKPCPFCGGAGIVEEAKHLDGVSVFCLECGARSGYGEKERHAIALWNTRVEPGGDMLPTCHRCGEEIIEEMTPKDAVITEHEAVKLQDTNNILDDHVFARMLYCAAATRGKIYQAADCCDWGDRILAECKRREGQNK